MANKEYVELSATYCRESPSAVLLNIDEKELWIPKSQIRNWPDDVYDEDDDVTFEIPEWLAIAKGLV